MWQIA
jgi:ribonuclease HI